MAGQDNLATRQSRESTDHTSLRLLWSVNISLWSVDISLWSVNISHCCLLTHIASSVMIGAVSHLDFVKIELGSSVKLLRQQTGDVDSRTECCFVSTQRQLVTVLGLGLRLG